MTGFRCCCVGIVLLAGLIASTTADARARNLRGPSARALTSESPSSVLLLALQDGPAGERILKEWTDFAERVSFMLPPIYVICSENSPHTAMVQDLPHIEPFMVTEGTSWATVLSVFRDQNTLSTVFGLLGEGVLPTADLDLSIASVEQALTGSLAPTAVLTRSRSRGDAANPPRWLPDTLITQIWCNRAMMTGLGLEDAGFQDSTLLELLPRFVHAHHTSISDDKLVIVDGTSILPSSFDLDREEEGRESAFVGNVAAVDGGSLYIGTIDHALVREEINNGAVTIGTALWPPPYVLETAALDNGLVIVNNVNCGYLDFATNFLLAARKVVSDVKVLWVAMDETAFDFMDSITPGCVAMFPSGDSERHRAIEAGEIGGDTFKSQVLIRPNVLLRILNQGYTLLWTDSDMVWLRNPLPSLPDIGGQGGVEIMLQADGSQGNPCTCLMFMKPTELVKELLVQWIETAEQTEARINQIVFRGPLHAQRDAGMRLEFFNADSFPSGKYFFENPYEENYAFIHYEDIMVVHNNYIHGHSRKRARFEQYHLWDIADYKFPSCGADQ